MSKRRQEVNMIFAINFSDINDPRYRAIVAIMNEGSMWTDRSVVYMSAHDSRDELVAEIEKLSYANSEAV